MDATNQRALASEVVKPKYAVAATAARDAIATFKSDMVKLAQLTRDEHTKGIPLAQESRATLISKLTAIAASAKAAFPNADAQGEVPDFADVLAAFGMTWEELSIPNPEPLPVDGAITDVILVTK